MQGKCFICGASYIHGLTGSIFSNDIKEGGEGVCDECHSEALDGAANED